MPIYATRDDLEAWTQTDAPDNVEPLIREASRLVRRATASSFYDTDGAGLPTDADTLQAFEDATCAQAASWVALGIDPAGGAAGAVGATGAVQASSLLSGSVTYNTTAQNSEAVTAAKMAAAVELCDASADILREAGLLSTGVWSYG